MKATTNFQVNTATDHVCSHAFSTNHIKRQESHKNTRDPPPPRLPLLSVQAALAGAGYVSHSVAPLGLSSASCVPSTSPTFSSSFPPFALLPAPRVPRLPGLCSATASQQAHRDPEMEKQALERGNLTPASPRPSREEPAESEASGKRCSSPTCQMMRITWLQMWFCRRQPVPSLTCHPVPCAVSTEYSPLVLSREGNFQLELQGVALWHAGHRVAGDRILWGQSWAFEQTQ